MKHKTMIIALVIMAGAFFTNAEASNDGKKKLKKNAAAMVENGNQQLFTTTDSVSYGAGLIIGRQIKEQVLPSMSSAFKGTPDSIDTQRFVEAVRNVLLAEQLLMNQEEGEKFFNQKANEASERYEQAYREENEQFLKDNLANEGVKVTESGLQYRILQEGTGEIPSATSKVVVKYAGSFIDGTEFDSSYKRNPQTITFPVNGVIKGWTEALTMMPVGSTWQLFIPWQLGYGSRGTGPIKPYSTLVFTVELIGIEK